MLVVPDLEAGNMLAKSLSFLAGADAAGIVLGARVPIILTSRADSLMTPPRVLRRGGHGRGGAAQVRACVNSLRGSSMSDGKIRPVLTGQKALVIGVANDQSIAYGCAKAFRTAGADLAITWLNEKARPHVEPLAQELGASITGALDVSVPGQLEAIFDHIRARWGRLDILVHSIAFAPKADLQGGLLNCSAEGFAKAMDVSCHSFVRMAKLAAPLMTEGGTMFAMSYYGANRVVPNYNVMGPVKAALEAACRYLAYELGPQGIRVHAISPGPLKTRAASGLKDFELLLNEAARKAPLGELVDIMDVGAPACIWRRRSPNASRAASFTSTGASTSSHEQARFSEVSGPILALASGLDADFRERGLARLPDLRKPRLHATGDIDSALDAATKFPGVRFARVCGSRRPRQLVAARPCELTHMGLEARPQTSAARFSVAAGGLDRQGTRQAGRCRSVRQERSAREDDHGAERHPSRQRCKAVFAPRGFLAHHSFAPSSALHPRVSVNVAARLEKRRGSGEKAQPAGRGP